MHRFHNILAGVDFKAQPSSGIPEISVASQEAIGQAVQLARDYAARLTFFSVLDMSERTFHRLTDQPWSGLSRTTETVVNNALTEQSELARRAGIESSFTLARGKAWLEISLQVMRSKHDLVVVGGGHSHGLRRLILGNTASNLIRKCPSPVWVCRGAGLPEAMRILVASDLTAVTDEALRIALALKQTRGAKVYLFHAVEFPLDQIWSTGLQDPTTEAYHERVRVEAKQSLYRQLERTAEGIPALEVDVQVADLISLADSAILNAIQRWNIDLLIIGTIARSGIPGVLIGNTAERLLPEVTCSMLTVKPVGFRSPIQPLVRTRVC